MLLDIPVVVQAVKKDKRTTKTKKRDNSTESSRLVSVLNCVEVNRIPNSSWSAQPIWFISVRLLLLWMVLYIKIANELQSWGMMGELITRGVYDGNSVGEE